MLKSCLPYLGSPDCVDNKKDDSKSNELEEAGNDMSRHNYNSQSFVSSNNSKHILVRVVHAGGKVDHYPNAVLAAKLLKTIPGKWLTHPQVFKQPYHSIIYPQDYLLPGHKYYVIPLSTIDKLMRKHSNNATIKFIIPPNNINQPNNTLRSMDDDHFSFSYAREFYANTHQRSTSSAINGSTAGSRKPRILLPNPNPKPKPKPKPKPCSAYAWEPGLTSIQELSP